MSKYDDDEAKWQAFVTKAFATAGLPEVEEHQLEIGTYTNAQIAGSFRHDPSRLLFLLMSVSKLGDPATKRSVLSFSVDLLRDEKE